MKMLLLPLIFTFAMAKEDCPVTEEQLRELQRVSNCGKSADAQECMEANGISLLRSENIVPASVGGALGAQAAYKAYINVLSQEQKPQKTGFLNLILNYIFNFAVAEYGTQQAGADVQQYAQQVERGIETRITGVQGQLRYIEETAYNLRTAEAQAASAAADQERFNVVKKFVEDFKKKYPEKISGPNHVLKMAENAVAETSGRHLDKVTAWQDVLSDIRAQMDPNFDSSHPSYRAIRVPDSAPAIPKPSPAEDLKFVKEQVEKIDKGMAKIEEDAKTKKIGGDQFYKARNELLERRRIYDGLLDTKEIAEKHLEHLQATQRFNRDFVVRTFDPNDKDKVLAYFAATENMTDDVMALHKRDVYLLEKFGRVDNMPKGESSRLKIREGRGVLAAAKAETSKIERDAGETFLKSLAKLAAKVGIKIGTYASTGPVGVVLAAEDVVEAAHWVIEDTMGCAISETSPYLTYHKCELAPDVLNQKMRNFLNLKNFDYQKYLLDSNRDLCTITKAAVKKFLPTRWVLKCNEKRDGFVASFAEEGLEQEVKLNRDGSIRKVIMKQDGDTDIDGGRTSFYLDQNQPRTLCVRDDTYLNRTTRKVAKFAEGKDPDDGPVCHPSYNNDVPLKALHTNARYFLEKEINGQKSLNFYRANMLATLEMAQCCGANADAANVDRCMAYEKKSDRSPAKVKSGKSSNPGDLKTVQ